MFKTAGFQAIALTAIIATSSASQTINGSSSDFLRRSSVSIALTQSRPIGGLGDNIGLGYGVSGAYLFSLDPQGILSVRAEVAGLQYGNESKRSAFSETVGDRVQVRTRTSNYIFPVTIGPQLAWPTGPVRPYVNAGVGAQAFVTESDVEGVDDLFIIARSTNQSDVTLAWVAGGGITIPIVRGATRAQLDLSMQYINGGRARYLAPGSIIDLQGGEVRVSSLESTTHLVMLRVGARIGL
jgi:opacity protein-like surface antigen